MSKHSGDAELATPDQQDQASMKSLAEGLAIICGDTLKLKKELRSDLVKLKDELKRDVRQEIATLQNNIYRKIAKNKQQMQRQGESITELQTRIQELEELTAESKDKLEKLANGTKCLNRN